MKTLQELYSEVLKSVELKNAFAAAVQDGKAADFLKTHGCEATAGELAAFLKEQQTKTGELSDDELDSVSGGCNGSEAAFSVVSLGVACAYVAIESKKEGERKGEDGRILCSTEYSLTSFTVDC